MNGRAPGYLFVSMPSFFEKPYLNSAKHQLLSRQGQMTDWLVAVR